MIATAPPRIALITGANKGIGFEVARRLGEAGLRVWLGARNAESGRAAAALLRETGSDVRAVHLDVLDPASISAAQAEIESQDRRLDVLVNNAAVNDPDDGSSGMARIDAVRRIMDTNFFGALAVTQAMLPLLRQSAAARIINQSSDLGSLTCQGDANWKFAFVKVLGYSASKAALNMLTVHLAAKLKDSGITVNSTNPGATATDLNQHRGHQTVEQGAAAAVRLALAEGDTITAGFFSMNQVEPWWHRRQECRSKRLLERRSDGERSFAFDGDDLHLERIEFGRLCAVHELFPYNCISLPKLLVSYRKKEYFMVVVSKLRAIVLAALLLSPTVVGAKTLKYSDHERLGGMRTRFINDVFFSAIERESNGRLKIEAHWEGKLSSSYDALSVVGKGRATDLAIVVPEYAEKNLPLHQIFKGFPVGPSGDRQVSFFRRVFAEIPEFRAELAKENVVPILYATGYPVAFFATKPLDSLDGIKAGKWRTASFWHADFLRNARAVPVSMPWGPKISEALQGGQLDGLMVNVDGGAQLNIGQAAPNVLISKNLWLGHVYLLVMNKDTWNGLAKEDQEAIGRAAESAYTTLGSVMNSSFDTQVNDLRKDGAKVRVLSPQEMAQWSDATDYQEVQNIWVNKQKGGLRKKARINLKNVRNIFNSFMN